MKQFSTLFLAYLLVSSPVFAQKTASSKFFDPNPDFKVETSQIRPFLDDIPEIVAKADYYQLSKTVLQTVMVVQSNAGRAISDGQFNYSRVISSDRNKQYPNFAKAKNGFVVCDHRRRGVELTALTMHQIRGGKKRALSDEKWMYLIFGPGGELEALNEPAVQVYRAIAAKPGSTTGGEISMAKTKEDLPLPEKTNAPKTEAMPQTTIPTKELAEVLTEKPKMPTEEPVVPKTETVPPATVPAKEPTPVLPEKPKMPAEKKVETIGETLPVPEKAAEKAPVAQAKPPKKDPAPTQVETQPSETKTSEPAAVAELPKPAEDTSSLIAPVKTRLNIIKSNILYPIALGYERSIGKHFSVSVNGFYLPSFAIGEPGAGGFGKKSLASPSFGFSAEGRYYTSRKKAPLTGFYLGGFFTRRDAKVSIQTITETSTSTTDATITVPSGLIMYGMMVGKQIIGKKGFTSDFGVGVGPYRVYSVPDIGSDAEQPFQTLSGYTKYKSGYGPRVTISMGYAF